MEALVAKAGRMALSATDARSFSRLFRDYLAAESQNQQDEHKGMADKIQIEAVQPMTVEGQRAAILAAIAAEKAKRRGD
jgi:hypothetical protein